MYEKLFAAYADGLRRLDPSAVVPFYGYPCTMVTDSFVGALTSADELTAALTQANEVYATFDVTEVRPEIVAVEELTEQLTRVRLRWHFLGAAGPLYDSEYEYLFRAGLIHVVVSLDEEPRTAAAPAR
jgi:hypothetical protein